MKKKGTLMCGLAALSISACGVSVEASTEPATTSGGAETEAIYESASYYLYYVDDDGFRETLDYGCIPLFEDVDDSIEVREDDGLDRVDLEFAWLGDGRNLMFSFYEDGRRVHRERVRSLNLARGYEVEQVLTTSLDTTYELVVAGDDCHFDR